MKIFELLAMLRSDGWLLFAVRTSHRQFKHGAKPGRITIAARTEHELSLGTLTSALKRAQLTP